MSLPPTTRAHRLKARIRRLRAFHYLHVVRLAGVRHLLRRERIVRHIDAAPARRTRPWGPDDPASTAAADVHMLIRAQDVRMAAWCLNSFYAAANVDWPLVFHQGGRMDARDWDYLKAKFPDAHLMTTAEGDARVQPLLKARGMTHALAVRPGSPMLRKMLDPVLLSSATSLFVPDSDVLFFRRPTELLDAAGRDDHRNMYNRDRSSYPYNIPQEEAQHRFGVVPASSLNAGVALLNRRSIRLDRVETYLGDPMVTSAPFFVEQTLHALLAAEFGADLLPATYACSVEPGLATPAGEPLIAKHYIQTPRPLLFEEGMVELLRRGVVGGAA